MSGSGLLFRPVRASICIVVTLVSLSLAGYRAQSAIASAPDSFPCPRALRLRVRFWARMFGEYSRRDFVIHDRDKVWRVYEVLHLPGSGPPSTQEIARAENYLHEKYRRALNWLGEGHKPITALQRKIVDMFDGAASSAYARAAGKLRVQQGLRELFRQGMLRSIHYRPMMEKIFERFGLPKGLVALAAVESEFNPRARSSAGAAGIWQFMRSTGRDYDLVSRHHDYRYDPRRSTEAAARLLSSNYALLHSWPLAITAYDYGAGAMLNAAQAFDGDYLRIIRDDDDPNLGFAVENYYSEFLAALKIYRHPNRYFPGLEPSKSPLLVASRYKVRRGDTLSAIARRYGVTVASLVNENHINNPRVLRAGRILSIPGSGPVLTATSYKVRGGDTLAGIARRYGVTVASLVSENRIDNPGILRIGQTLRIPGRPGGHSRARAHRYALRRGDTLYAIAQRYGASVKALLEANGIDDPRSLTIGQVIYIPGT